MLLVVLAAGLQLFVLRLNSQVDWLVGVLEARDLLIDRLAQDLDIGAKSPAEYVGRARATGPVSTESQLLWGHPQPAAPRARRPGAAPALIASDRHRAAETTFTQTRSSASLLGGE